MGQFDFQSPGAAAGNALLDTLTRQRVEERQRLLDEVNKRNIESEMSARAENAKSMAAERNAMDAWRTSQAKDITDRDAERAAWKTNLKNYMASPEYAQLPKEAQQSIGIASMSGDPSLIKSTLDNLTTPKKDAHPMVPIWHKSRDGSMYDTGQEAPAGSIIANESEPQPQQQHWLDWGPEETVDEAGVKTQTGNRVIFNTNTKQIDRIPVRLGAKTPPAPRTAQTRLLDMIPSDVRTEFSRQRQRFAAGQANSFASSQDSAISSARQVHPDVKATVRDVLKYGQSKTYDEIIQAHKGVFSDKINPTTGRSDQSDFEDLVAFVKGS